MSSPPDYRSAHGPKYQYRPHVFGLNAKSLMRLGVNSAAFGGVALFTVLFFASGIPRVKKDILQKIPYIGPKYFVNNIHPADAAF